MLWSGTEGTVGIEGTDGTEGSDSGLMVIDWPSALMVADVELRSAEPETGMPLADPLIVAPLLSALMEAEPWPVLSEPLAEPPLVPPDTLAEPAAGPETDPLPETEPLPDDGETLLELLALAPMPPELALPEV